MRSRDHRTHGFEVYLDVNIWVLPLSAAVSLYWTSEASEAVFFPGTVTTDHSP